MWLFLSLSLSLLLFLFLFPFSHARKQDESFIQMQMDTASNIHYTLPCRFLVVSYAFIVWVCSAFMWLLTKTSFVDVRYLFHFVFLSFRRPKNTFLSYLSNSILSVLTGETEIPKFTKCHHFCNSEEGFFEKHLFNNQTILTIW